MDWTPADAWTNTAAWGAHGATASLALSASGAGVGAATATAALTLTATGAASGGGGSTGGITQVGVATEWDSGGLTVTTVGPVASPTGTTVDDVLVWRVSGAINTVVTTPTGWTLVQSNSNVAQTEAVFLRRIQTGDPTSHSMTVGSTRWTSELTCWRGVDATSPLDVASPPAASALGLQTPPPITTVTAGARVMMAFHATIAANASEVITSSSNMIKLGRSYSNNPTQTGAQGATFAADHPAAGTFSPNLTSDIAPTRSTVITLALRPAPGAAGIAATGTAALTLTATGAGSAPAAGTASLSLTATGAARAAATATAQLALSATGATRATATGTAALTLTATGTGRATATGTAVLALTATGAARAVATGTAALTLTATGTGRATATGTAAIDITAAGTARTPTTGAATLALIATGALAAQANATAMLALVATGTAETFAPAIDIAVVIGPTRIRSTANVGATRTSVTIAFTRTGTAIGDTRQRAPATVDATRSRAAASAGQTRQGVTVGNTRQGVTVGASRQQRGS